MYKFLKADLESLDNPVRTHKGKILMPVAIQVSRRKKGGKDVIIVHKQDTEGIYQEQGAYYVPLAHDDKEMKKYFDIFTGEELSKKQKEWLELNDYELLE